MPCVVGWEYAVWDPGPGRTLIWGINGDVTPGGGDPPVVATQRVMDGKRVWVGCAPAQATRSSAKGLSGGLPA